MVIHSFYPLLSLFSFVSFPGIRLCYSFSWVWCPHRSVWIFIELARRNCTGASTIIHNVWIVTQRHPSRLWGWIYYVICGRFTPEKCYKNKSNKVQLKPLPQRITTQKLYTSIQNILHKFQQFFENPTELKFSRVNHSIIYRIDAYNKQKWIIHRLPLIDTINDRKYFCLKQDCFQNLLT